MRQDLIDEHAGRVGSLVAEFSRQNNEVTEKVTEHVLGFLRRSLSISDGSVAEGAGNVAVVRDLDKVFFQALPFSGHHEVVSALVSQLPAQVVEFEQLYVEMQKDVPELPTRSTLSSEGAEVLGLRAALSISSFDASTRVVAANLRKASLLAMGRVTTESFISYIGGIVGKLSGLGSQANDIVFSFFRDVAQSAYSVIDPAGDQLLLRYVGKSGVGKRAFCAGQLGSTRTISQINALDNRQLPNPLVTAGGFGCGHYWVISGTV